MAVNISMDMLLAHKHALLILIMLSQRSYYVTKDIANAVKD